MREELEVVLQGDEIVFADLGVGGIGVLHVNRTIPQRFVAESVIDPDDILGWELILSRERPPAIPAIKEFMGQAELQLRMASQIADRANLLSLGIGAPHDERVGVVEAELTGHADAKSGELFSHFGCETMTGDTLRISSPMVPVYSG